ncbi:hypothetical protein EIN_377670 [Entamoeba invadens IP1]|uniref:Protein kinase domain-containing protein n=1 Tax=Entamoeba invadens IP1 TaxID=370355 RepID=A0A0A1TU79_ENTIV|nr:hypothetical protein EIN_377670 [Entamoeba invadens IP1]ELP83512.1 hypothetical protein EIN_377670 [Entamoeba invadens IP1]|eukprot:XP_004182858.1 hypothetical protein EIN_377670 [Entamoeba invadens IP1]
MLLFFILSLSFALDHCKSQISDNHCIECESGYYLQLTDNTDSGIPSLLCVAIGVSENCEITDNGACVKCLPKFYLDGNQCKSCSMEFCNYCNSTFCYQCGSNAAGTQLYLSTDETKCVDCTDPAHDEDCGRCPGGKYFDIDTKRCEKCMTNCALCTEKYNCYQCTNKTLLSKTDVPTPNEPDKCNPISNCDETEGLQDDHCELCNSGYRLEAGDCVSCGTNCSVCYKTDTGENYCSVCKTDYVMTNGQCKSKDDLHCLEGSETYGCLQCESGRYFSASLECLLCDATCSTCVSEASHCLSCNENYYFLNGTTQCVPKDGNCSLVDQAGCKECYNDLTTEGQKTAGYFVPKGGQECQPCESHCKLCEDEATHCSACITNYTLKKVEGEDYYICENMSEFCLKTEMGYCTECVSGFFIKNGESQQCSQCDLSCSTCKESNKCLSCKEGYYLSKYEQDLDNKTTCRSQKEINSTCQAGINGCETCFPGYYINHDDPKQYICQKCPDECSECVWKSTDTNDNTVGIPICTTCNTVKEYVNDGQCKPCSELTQCFECEGEKCKKCNDGYSLDAGGVSCSKTNWALIVPLVIVAIIIIIVLLLLFIGLIWWRRTKSVKAETAAIKPFHVGSDLELMLLGADNEKFPLKTDKWELSFDLAKSKAIVDQEYTETVNLANMSKKQYYFEFHYTPSHKYDLEITPKSATLKSSTAIPVTFKIKMLCTTSVSDNIGISAMDIDDQNKETAKFTVVIESDLSLKLDHTELKPIMPPIGEGAFGMVFRGTYRGRDVAIKKMKARNLTQEQEKEFNHEVSMMTQLRHNCVVELIGAVYTEGEISIVTEFAEYGSLSKIWGKQPVNYQLKVKILDDMAVALAYLHQNNIIHRDVKGENLLLFSLNPHSPVCAKLTDFGTCRNISERNLASKALSQGIGTPTYMPPECLQNSSEYSYPVDVYAYGMVLFETYVEKNAYENDERFNQPWMIPQFVIEGQRLDKPNGIPENYWELTTKCWSQNAEDRPTFADVLKTIESWGEDIRYALNIEGEKKAGAGGASDISSNSTPSVPSSAQEPSITSSSDNTPSGPQSSLPKSVGKRVEKDKEKSSSSSSED